MVIYNHHGEKLTGLLPEDIEEETRIIGNVQKVDHGVERISRCVVYFAGKAEGGTADYYRPICTQEVTISGQPIGAVETHTARELYTGEMVIFCYSITQLY